MVLFANGIIAPEEGIIHVEANAHIKNAKEDLGKGTFYITESGISFVRDDGQGFLLTYNDVGVFGVSRKQDDDFPEDCLFIMTTILYSERGQSENNGPSNRSGDEDEDTESSSEEEAQPYEDLYVFITNKEELQTLYQKLLGAQKEATKNESIQGPGIGDWIGGGDHEVDEDEEDEDDDNYEDAEDDQPVPNGGMAGGDAGGGGDMADALLQENETFEPNEDDEPMDVEQFEDAGF